MPTRADGDSRAGEQKHVAVVCRIDDGLGGERAARAGAIFHRKLIAHMLRQPLRHHARGKVGRAARREADDHADRPRRKIERGSAARRGRERD
jgi:hypothetical protein